jgi:hypothetical protein
MKPMSQHQEDALRMAVFLFNLEEEKGGGYTYGGMKLGDVIDGFCRFTHIERAVWEGIAHPDEPIKPRIGGS